MIYYFEHVAGSRLHSPSVGVVHIHDLLLDRGQVRTDACEGERLNDSTEVFSDDAY